MYDAGKFHCAFAVSIGFYGGSEATEWLTIIALLIWRYGVKTQVLTEFPKGSTRRWFYDVVADANVINT
jgi:hypothetical protein